MAGALQRQHQQQPSWKRYIYQEIDGNHDSSSEQQTSGTQVAKDGTFFKHMLDLVPASFYFDQDSKNQLKLRRDGADQGGSDDDSADSSTEEAVKLKISKGKRMLYAESKAEDVLRNKQHKRARFDPLHVKTVTQMQQELLDMSREAKDSSSRDKIPKSGAHGGVQSTSGNTEDLRERLRLKLQDMQGKRKVADHIDRIERKKQKRRESKHRLKMKRRNGNQSQKGENSKLTNGFMTPKSKFGTSVKPVFNKEGKMVFSKFDFTDNVRPQTQKSDLPTGSNYKQLLQKVQKRKEKMQDIQSKDAEKASKIKQKMAWKTALSKAEGVKVKDNPELLKKAIKKKEQKKEKRKRDWTERKEKVDEQMKKKQDKRQRNIKKKKQARIDKKIKKAKKKGRIIPGF